MRRPAKVAPARPSEADAALAAAREGSGWFSCWRHPYIPAHWRRCSGPSGLFYARGQTRVIGTLQPMRAENTWQVALSASGPLGPVDLATVRDILDEFFDEEVVRSNLELTQTATITLCVFETYVEAAELVRAAQERPAAGAWAKTAQASIDP